MQPRRKTFVEKSTSWHDDALWTALNEVGFPTLQDKLLCKDSFLNHDWLERGYLRPFWGRDKTGG